jgi:hypothetical protein
VYSPYIDSLLTFNRCCPSLGRSALQTERCARCRIVCELLRSLFTIHPMKCPSALLEASASSRG